MRAHDQFGAVTDSRFVAEQRVRPRHCDAQAMVRAARYHDFYEDAFLGWLEALGLPYRELRANGVDLVITESRYSYRRPATLDDHLQIGVTRRDGDLLATAEITYV